MGVAQPLAKKAMSVSAAVQLAVDANRYDWYLSSQALRAKELYLRHFPKEMR